MSEAVPESGYRNPLPLAHCIDFVMTKLKQEISRWVVRYVFSPSNCIYTNDNNNVAALFLAAKWSAVHLSSSSAAASALCARSRVTKSERPLAAANMSRVRPD